MHAMTRRVFAMVMVLALTASWAAAAQGQTMDELKKRFQDRYPALSKAKDEGKIGEVVTGYVEPVKDEHAKDEAIKKMSDDENADRKRLYELIAEQEKTTPQIVAERNARRNFERAKSGHWLKGKDGQWVQKK